MTVRLRVLAAATCLSLTGLLTTAGATLAAGPVSSLSPDAVQTLTLGGPNGAALLPLQVDQLYPGIGIHARFVLRRGTGFTGGTFAVGVVDIEDLERGCNRPEVNTGDTTCGDGTDQGELSQQLLVGQSWTADVSSCATAPVPTTGTAMAAAAGVLALTPGPLSTADEVCLVLGLMLPISADNRVQTDLVRFSLRLGLQNGQPVVSPDATASPISGTPQAPAVGTQAPAEPAPTNTAGPPQSTPSPAAALPGSLTTQPRALPFTGGQLLLLAGWAALSLVLGVALLHVARHPAT